MKPLSSIKNFFCDVLGIETKEEKALREQNSPEPKERQQPATDEEKKAKEREWRDLNEEDKFACQGGNIQCKYCNPPIAENDTRLLIFIVLSLSAFIPAHA